MRYFLTKLSLLTLFFSCACVAVRAQEVVHALTGTITSIDSNSKQLQVATDDGSEGQFTTQLQPGTHLDFSKAVRSSATPAANFQKTKTRVLLYYIGDNSVRTAVAVEDLGAGPFVTIVGNIVKMDHHTHEIVVKDQSGAEKSFKIDSKTVAEASEGVEDGLKFDGHKGDRVRIVASMENGAPVALFIRIVSLDTYA